MENTLLQRGPGCTILPSLLVFFCVFFLVRAILFPVKCPFIYSVGLRRILSAKCSMMRLAQKIRSHSVLIRTILIPFSAGSCSSSYTYTHTRVILRNVGSFWQARAWVCVWLCHSTYTLTLAHMKMCMNVLALWLDIFFTPFSTQYKYNVCAWHRYRSNFIDLSVHCYILCCVCRVTVAIVHGICRVSEPKHLAIYFRHFAIHQIHFDCTVRCHSLVNGCAHKRRSLLHITKP